MTHDETPQTTPPAPKVPLSKEPLTAHDRTAVGPTTGERAVLWAGFPALGAVASWLVSRAAGWVASLPWAPMQGPFKLIASAPEPLLSIASVAVGALLGLAVAFFAEREYVTADIGPDQAALTVDGVTRTVPRAATAAVFRDGKNLVLLGHDTAELVRMRGDFDADRFAAAFARHGYPWHPDGDPYAADFRRWVAAQPDLSGAAHALFKARAHALKKDEKKDAEQLREELARLGVVVRDDKDKAQHWRLVHPAQDTDTPTE
ncbi:YqeB family protein [Streptomyces chrestomyceticus]|uniref:YqeB family protein n=1 Tax=Streptomyces chrestomyceticus TaxID=68185 RepID=UPI0033D68B6F